MYKWIKWLYISILVVTPLYPGIPQMPIKPDPDRSLAHEWAEKTVLDSKPLSDMENLDNWRHTGFGEMTLSDVRSHQGNKSLLLTCPTKGTKPGPERGRPFGACNAIYVPQNQDLRDWNRISFWVYPDMPGFKTVVMCMILHNEGEEQVPDQYDRNGFNYLVLENQKWNRVNWEVEHLGRDKVTGIELRYRMQGNEPGATDTARYFFDELELHKVEPDYYEGWGVAPGHIAFANTGYANGYPKIALSSEHTIKKFSLVDAESEKVVLTKDTEIRETPLGKFVIMDFSEYTTTGEYKLYAGDMETGSFRIGTFADVYNSSIIKTINHFYCQRCGTYIEGIHDACHLDWMTKHDDQSLMINGGWHDAGDLSQGMGNTTESINSMLELAEQLRETEPELADRLLEEGRWGLEWLLKTRFGDGYRSVWATMDFWTDGIIGTVDDMTGRAWNSAGSNYLAAGTEARAALAFRERDPFLADYALQCAEQDWEFAGAGIRNERMEAELAAQGLHASLLLYQVTGKEKYRDKSIEYGDTILSCQQQGALTPGIDLQGFFYRDSSKSGILHYEHLSHEQDIIIGLVELCKQFPDHPRFADWDRAIRLYTDYYKHIIRYTAPWHMVPAGIYDVEKARDDTEAEQIRNGIKLDDRYYIRRFPVWKTFRGNCGTVLSQTKGLSEAADYLNDMELRQLCYQQLQWVLGMNPFCQSLMYGEGYRYADQYSAMSGNITGGLPVGIQTHFNRDAPYWPAENCYNWKEIWVHPSGRWLWIMSDFYAF